MGAAISWGDISETDPRGEEQSHHPSPLQASLARAGVSQPCSEYSLQPLNLPAEALSTVAWKQALPAMPSLHLYVSPIHGRLMPLKFGDICYSVTVTGTSWFLEQSLGFQSQADLFLDPSPAISQLRDAGKVT